MKTLNYEQLYSMRRNQDNYVLIDVRPFDVYEERHITDSDNIPLSEEDFEELVERRVVSKDSKVVVYCGSFECPLSKQAAERLEKAGFTNVYDYEGGLKDWTTHQKQEAA